MNYFEFYAGDYQRDTADLSLAEHGAFLMLLSTYYSTERPIPADNPTLFRLVRAMDENEKASVISVADRFFPVDPVDGMRHNARADREIAKARARIDLARENGKRGGRPKNPEKTQPLTQPLSKPLTQPLTQNEPSGKAHHTPHAIKDQKISNPKGLEVGIPSDPSSVPDGKKVEAKRRKHCPVTQIVALYHECLPNNPAVEKVTDARAGYIRQRWLEDLTTLDAWKNYFEYVSKSAFLTGRTQGRDGKAPFVADIEFLTKPASFTKIVEEKYHR